MGSRTAMRRSFLKVNAASAEVKDYQSEKIQLGSKEGRNIQTPSRRFRPNQFEASHLRKMPLIESSERAAALQGAGSHNQVVVANHPAGYFEFGPDTGMLQGGRFPVGNDQHILHNGSQIPLTLRFVGKVCALDPVPYFRDGDRGNLDPLAGTSRQPSP